MDQWPWVKTLEAHVDFIDSGVSSPAAPRESDEVIAELLMQGSVAMSQSEPINVGVIMDRDKTLRETRQKEYLRSGTIQFVPGADYGSGIRGLVAPLGFAILKRPDATKKDYEAAFEFALSWLTEDAQRDVFEFSGGLPASTKTMDNLLKLARENMAKSPPDYSLQLIDALWPLVKDTTKNVLFPPFPAFVNVVYDIQAGWGEKAWLKQISPQEAMNNAANETRKLIKDLGFAKK
ncbi:hypothetical protein HRbin06_00198 [archaeon HR06]|nr:hypothetical protein HRbin06_00198 [archaeon HR06]